MIEDFRWAVSEIVRSLLCGLMVCWGLWMLDTSLWRATVVGALVGFSILSGIASHRLRQAALLCFWLGVIVWAHIPIIDKVHIIVDRWVAHAL